LPLDCRSTFKK